MRIERAMIVEYGGQEAVTVAVADLAAAWAAHASTVGVAAPSAPPLIEAIWRAGGMDAVEIIESADQPPPPPPRTISALAFRRRFSNQERAAITLAASRGLEAGDATLQLWIDDLNAAGSIDLDLATVAEGLQALVQAGLIADGRVSEILA